MATVSRHSAVAEFPGDIRLEGVFAWLSWLILHLVLLVGFHNRMHVLISWLCTYLTHNRSARLILLGAASRESAKPAPVQPRVQRLVESHDTCRTGQEPAHTIPSTNDAVDPLRHIKLLLEQQRQDPRARRS
jgi:hypothetical protein